MPTPHDDSFVWMCELHRYIQALEKVRRREIKQRGEGSPQEQAVLARIREVVPMLREAIEENEKWLNTSE